MGGNNSRRENFLYSNIFCMACLPIKSSVTLCNFGITQCIFFKTLFYFVV